MEKQKDRRNIHRERGREEKTIQNGQDTNKNVSGQSGNWHLPPHSKKIANALCSPKVNGACWNDIATLPSSVTYVRVCAIRSGSSSTIISCFCSCCCCCGWSVLGCSARTACWGSVDMMRFVSCWSQVSARDMDPNSGFPLGPFPRCPGWCSLVPWYGCEGLSVPGS